MTTSDKIADELWDRLELLALTEEETGQRQDVTTLLRFREDGCNPLYLFWDLYQPEAVDPEAKAHSHSSNFEELQETISNLLDRLYEQHRLPYQPDQGHGINSYLDHLECAEDILFHRDYQQDGYSPEDFTSEEFCRTLTLPPDLRDLLVFLHVAAARAFLLKRRHGYSDDVRDCLREVERTIGCLKLAGLDMGPMYQHSIGIFQSAYAVSAMSFVELGSISYREGRYTEALHYFAQADAYYEPSAYPTDDDEDWPFEWVFLTYLPDEESARLHLRERVSDHRFGAFRATGLYISLKEIVGAFHSIQVNRDPETDWKQVAQDCMRLSDTFLLRFIECEDEYQEYMEEGYSLEEFIDRRVLVEDHTAVGSQVRWGVFWYGAYVWASSQLSRSAFQEMQAEYERNAGERRLKTYFFGSDWSYIPERAQGRLINADLLLNSPQTVALDSLLNELRVATEEMCFEVIWKPLANARRGSSDLLEFLKVKRSLVERNRDPSITQYISICRSDWYRNFLVSQSIENDDIRFLTATLPRDMSQLKGERDLAEHRPGRPVSRTSVESFYKGFLGIGRSGTLPELVAIVRRLKGSNTHSS